MRRTKEMVAFIIIIISFSLVIANEGIAAEWIQVSSPTTEGTYYKVAVGDFDNDGRSDIVGAGTKQTGLHVWFGDGSGNWVKEIILSEDYYVGVSVGDIDEDGDLDIVGSSWKEVVGTREGNGLVVWLNDGNGGFAAGNSPDPVGVYAYNVLADINKDGHLDIIAADWCDLIPKLWENACGVKAYLGDGANNWTAMAPLSETGLYIGVAAGDINHDGYLDVVAASRFWPGAITVWFGDGGNSWTQGQSPSPPPVPPVADCDNYRGVSLSDLNNDGYLEIIAGSMKFAIFVWSWDGTGNWQWVNSPTPTYDGSFRDVLSADLNMDGLPDIVAASRRNGVEAFINTGDFTYRSASDGLIHAGFYRGLALEDINMDGKLDIVAGGANRGVQVFLNNFQ